VKKSDNPGKGRLWVGHLQQIRRIIIDLLRHDNGTGGALVKAFDEFGSVGEGNVVGGGRLERGYPADDLVTVAFEMPADMFGKALEWDLHCIVLFSHQGGRPAMTFVRRYYFLEASVLP
jgi:hypothetical protein